MQPQSNFNPYAPPTAAVDQGLNMNLGGYELADRGTRLGAVLIDGLLMAAAALPAGVLAIFLGVFSSNAFGRGDAELAMYGALGLMGLMVLAFQIYQWYLIATTGQSLGKRWLGVQIVRVDGTPLGFVHGVILRSWVMGAIGNIPLVGGIASIVNILMIFGDERRCLHDHLAGTRVIVAPRT
jgi:uncharacterized RDD family membrane protein YckC